MIFTFKVWQTAKETWPTYKLYFWPFFGLTLVTLLLNSIEQKENYILPILLVLLSFVISYVWFRSTLNLVDGKGFLPFERENLPSWKQYWYFIFTGILSSLIMAAGGILFIIPGLYFMGRLMFACYLNIDKNLGPIESIKASWRMTKGYGWKILGKSITICLFFLLGFIALFVGLFITYPIGMVVFTKFYREFEKFKQGIPTIVPQENQTTTV